MTFRHLGDVLAEADELGRRFSQAGHRIFLVGGIVRDQWLDAPLASSSDIDLTTDARPAEIKRTVAPIADDLWTQGERFGTIGLRAQGRAYEITTHRAESYNSDSRKPDVTFGDDVTVDLSRRDFTVNAMAIELPGGELVDPWGGVADLRARVLRTPLDPDISFSDDPLRMLRAARFATKYGLVPDPELVASAADLHQRLRIVAIERIGVELERLLGLSEAAIGLRFLATTGLLAEVLAFGEPALVGEVEAVVDEAVTVAGRLPNDWRLRLAGLGLAVFDDEQAIGALCRRLRLSGNDSRHVMNLTRSALAIMAADGTTIDVALLRRWAMSSSRHHDAIALAKAVAPTSPAPPRFESALIDLAKAEDLSGDVAFLDGQEIMKALDISSGPAVGQATAYLHERYFELGPLPEATQIELLRTWWTDRATNV